MDDQLAVIDPPAAVDNSRPIVTPLATRRAACGGPEEIDGAGNCWTTWNQRGIR